MWNALPYHLMFYNIDVGYGPSPTALLPYSGSEILWDNVMENAIRDMNDNDLKTV